MQRIVLISVLAALHSKYHKHYVLEPLGWISGEALINSRNVLWWASFKLVQLSWKSSFFLFSNVKPKRQELILKRTFKSKKFLCLCFWVCGWTRNGWCSLSPWIVCHSHYFLFFFLPFCLCQFSESMNKIACIFTDKREKPVFPFIISFAETKK